MSDMATRSRRGVVAWLVVILLALGLGIVLGRWAFVAPQIESGTDSPATVVVSEMTVGWSIPVSVSAVWVDRPFGVGAASGVLTSLAVADGAMVSAGDVLYTADLRPVVAGVGSIPAFRDLVEGSVGVDVVQLQQLLASVGFMSAGADGEFGAATRQAVQAWQKSIGVEADGIVRAGDIVYATHLPARVRLAEGIEIGQRLTQGDVVLSVLDGEPEFQATVMAEAVIDPSLPIEVVFADETVRAVRASTRQEAGYSVWLLTREDGTSICGEQCDQVSLEPAQAVFEARQILTPDATGPGVPAAAVWFTAGGNPYVVLPDGSQVPVTIVGEGQGSVVLDGVDLGTTVVLADESVPGPSTEESPVAESESSGSSAPLPAPTASES